MPSSHRRRSGPSKPTTGHFDPTSLPPVEEAADDGRYAARAWGSLRTYEDLTFPSGQLALVRRPGLEGLLKEGVLNNLDTLSPFIEEHAAKANGKVVKKGPSVTELMKNPEAVEQMIHVLDRIVCACVVKPRIEMTPNDPTRRKHGVVYCDMVDLDDKLFLFNYVVGGTRDLERFRQESADALGGLRELQEDEGDAV